MRTSGHPTRPERGARAPCRWKEGTESKALHMFLRGRCGGTFQKSLLKRAPALPQEPHRFLSLRLPADLCPTFPVLFSFCSDGGRGPHSLWGTVPHVLRAGPQALLPVQTPCKSVHSITLSSGGSVAPPVVRQYGGESPPSESPPSCH